MPRGRPKSDPSPERGKTTRLGGAPSRVMPKVAVPELEEDEPTALRSLTATTLAKLAQMRDSVSKQMAEGEVTAASQREGAGLARAIVALGAEMRQQEKFYDKEARSMTLDDEEAMIVEWLGEQTPGRRARVRRAMDEMDAETSLLG